MKHQRLRIGLRLSVTLFMVGLIAVGMVGPISANAASSYTVTVYPAYQDQMIEGWGTSLAWWANRAGGWDDATRNAIADALYDPVKGIGLNIARYNFGGDTPTNSCHNQMPNGRNVPSYEPSLGNFDWSQDANQRWMIQAAQARGADIFEGFVNAPPNWMLNNNCTAGSTLPGQDNISSSQYNNFTSYMTTIAKHFHDVWGVPLRTLEPFNEPSSWWWLSSGKQEAMYVSQGTQNAIVNQLGAALTNQGMNEYSNVSASDDNSIDKGLNSYNSYDSSAQGYLTQWNTHGYNGSNRSGSYSDVGQKGNKRIWMSEWGEDAQSSPMAAALDLSNRILLDEQQLHPTGWVSWQALNESGGASNGNDLWGLIAGDNTTGLSYPQRYWAFGNYSKFVRPGYKMIENSDTNSFTAYNAGTNTLVIVTTNSSSSDATVTYDLSSFDNVGDSATPYQTSATRNLQQLDGVAINNKQFNSVLPASSITTFVIPNVTYTGPGASTEVNNVLQESRGSTTGKSATMTFQGSHIRLFGDKAPDNGIGLISVDNGPFSEVDFYAAHSASNQLMWESPQLSAGTHTLTLKVAGTKNPQSDGYMVAPDRVETDPTVAGSPNLLSNGNFETGNISPWQGDISPSQSGIETTYPWNGNYDAYLHPTLFQNVGLYQTVTAPATRTYTLAAYVANNTGNVQFGVDVNGQQIRNLNVAGGGAYHLYVTTFTAQSGQPIKVWCYAHTYPLNGWATIDDVTLY